MCCVLFFLGVISLLRVSGFLLPELDFILYRNKAKLPPAGAAPHFHSILNINISFPKWSRTLIDILGMVLYHMIHNLQLRIGSLKDTILLQAFAQSQHTAR